MLGEDSLAPARQPDNVILAGAGSDGGREKFKGLGIEEIDSAEEAMGCLHAFATEGDPLAADRRI